MYLRSLTFIKYLRNTAILCGLFSLLSFQVVKISVEDYKGKKIVIGTEGGIIPLRNETIILQSGEVFWHNNGIKEYKYMKKLTRMQTKIVFRLINSNKLPHKDFNHPGNMSTFLEYYNHRKIKKQYVWGEPGVEIPASLDQTYSEIINIIK